MAAEPVSNLLRRSGPPEPVSHVDPPRALDPRFSEVVPHHASLVSLYDQATFGEGPTWWPAQNILVWSDIEGRRVLGWHPDGCVRVVIDATPFINGNTVDWNGDLIHCEHGNRRLSRTTPDGRYAAVVETYEGRRFNAPNDVVCAADGALWLFDGDLAVVDRSLSPRNGDIVVVDVDGERSFKVWRRQGHRITLSFANPRFPEFRLSPGAEVEVWGVVTGSINPRRRSE